MLSQSAATRVAGFATQIVLAWLLEPEDFGLIGLAYAIQAFANIVLGSGIGVMLISRPNEYHKLANGGFWYSIGTGLVAAGIMLLAAPVGARLLDSPELVGLLLIMALVAPIRAMWAVPHSALLIQFRFRASAMINLLYWVGGMALSVVFALAGFGAFSFVLPLLITTPICALILFCWLGRPFNGGCKFRNGNRWSGSPPLFC